MRKSLIFSILGLLFTLNLSAEITPNPDSTSSIQEGFAIVVRGLQIDEKSNFEWVRVKKHEDGSYFEPIKKKMPIREWNIMRRKYNIEHPGKKFNKKRTYFIWDTVKGQVAYFVPDQTKVN